KDSTAPLSHFNYGDYYSHCKWTFKRFLGLSPWDEFNLRQLQEFGITLEDTKEDYKTEPENLPKRMSPETIKAILLQIINQLADGAPTNQNILPCKGYIPLKSYDCGDVTHFAIIKQKPSIPESIVELGFDYDNNEFYAYDDKANFLFDVVLDDMIDEEQITKEMLVTFKRVYGNYYGTFCSINE
ncbi:hypothetical protein, partial [Methanobrevibacter sp.]